MANNRKNKRRSFKQLEQMLTLAVLLDLLLFVLVMITSNAGIGWLKVILGILSMALSFAGCGFLVLIGEHSKARSWWILAAFGSLFLCTLVSLITGSPAPAIAPLP